MEEEGVMVTCGKLTLGPAIENPPTENLATENPATENPPTEETLAEVETITATDEVADNEMVNDSVKPGDEEVDPVQEIAVAAEVPPEENCQDTVATQLEPSETTASMEEMSECLQESTHEGEEATNNGTMEKCNASQFSEEVTRDKEVMETVTSVGQLDKSESHKNVSAEETALARGDDIVEAQLEEKNETPIDEIGENGDIKEGTESG